MVTDTDQYYNYNMIFEIITLQNFQNWKQLLTIPNELDGWPATRPSASMNCLDITTNKSKAYYTKMVLII